MLTVKQLSAAKPGKWLSDGSARRAGVLLVRRTGGGMSLYFRYTLPNGKRDILSIGTYDENGRNGLTLAQARDRAGELSRLYQSGIKNLRGHLEAQEQTRKDAKEAERRAREAAAQEAEAKAKYTVRTLCEAYCAMLEGRGKIASAKHARSIFKHVPAETADLPAKEVTARQLGAVIRKVHEEGKERTAGILRSYLRAAYGAAIAAETDPSIPSTFIGFDIESNPVSDIKAGRVRAGNRTLTEAELREYLKRLKDGIIDQALRLALLAGGQRMVQLLRARVGDWDSRSRILRLWDPKGKRAEPREHLLPLGPKGTALVEQLIQRARAEADNLSKSGPAEQNPSLFLSTGGAVVAPSTPGKRAAAIAEEMKGELFNLRDIRRTVETRLAGLGINRDIRGQLMSHGLSGVQNTHYDRHDYMIEKRQALVAWERYLERLETDTKGHTGVKMKRKAAPSR